MTFPQSIVFKKHVMFAPPMKAINPKGFVQCLVDILNVQEEALGKHTVARDGHGAGDPGTNHGKIMKKPYNIDVFSWDWLKIRYQNMSWFITIVSV